MIFELVEQSDISGSKTRIYSILIHDESSPSHELSTLYEQFIFQHVNEYEEDVWDIEGRLYAIGNLTGLRDNFYKPYEGIPGDGICVLFDKPNKNLRLYFIGYGKVAIVLGGGGPKSKDLRAFQESDELTNANYLLRKIAAVLNEAIKNGRLKLTENGFISKDGFVFDC